MSRAGRRRNDGKSSLELRKLRAETRIAERQLDEMRLPMTYETIKVGVGVLIGGRSMPERPVEAVHRAFWPGPARSKCRHNPNIRKEHTVCHGNGI